MEGYCTYMASAETAARREIAEDVRSLLERQALLQTERYSVVYFRSAQGRKLLQEIGRLRELSFGHAADGTRAGFGLDQFDEYYIHLCLWNLDRKEVVGSYRLGAVEEIVDTLGLGGLYTSTLFRYTSTFLSEIAPSLELGRAFVRPEYQGRPLPLKLLLGAILRYAAMGPEYRALFGPVSISNEFKTASRQLLVTFLRRNFLAAGLAGLVRPRTPLSFGPSSNWDPDVNRSISDLDDVGKLISDIEPDRKRLPTLLRCYLKLFRSKVLGFNLERNAGGELDILLLTNVAEVEAKVLRYFTNEKHAVRGLASRACHA